MVQTVLTDSDMLDDWLQLTCQYRSMNNDTWIIIDRNYNWDAGEYSADLFTSFFFIIPTSYLHRDIVMWWYCCYAVGPSIDCFGCFGTLVEQLVKIIDSLFTALEWHPFQVEVEVNLVSRLEGCLNQFCLQIPKVTEVWWQGSHSGLQCGEKKSLNYLLTSSREFVLECKYHVHNQVEHIIEDASTVNKELILIVLYW